VRHKSSLIPPTMRRRILINPVFFFPTHSAPARHLPRRTSLIERTRLRPVTERLKSIPLLPRIPVVDNHLNRHPAAPHTAPAATLICPRSQAAMSSCPVRRQINRRAMPGWGRIILWYSPLQHLQLAGLVILGTANGNPG